MRPLIGSLKLEDYEYIRDGVQAAKDATNFFCSMGARIEIPVEHRWWEYGSAIQMLVDYRLPLSASVLDVGSGRGAFGPALAYIYDVQVTECEPGSDHLDRVGINRLLSEVGRPEMKVLPNTADNLPDEQYDMVSCISVIEHMTFTDECKVWQHLVDRVKPGGLLFIDMDCVPDNQKKYVFDELRAHNWTIDEIRTRVEGLKAMGMAPIAGEEYQWNGALVYDYSFFRIGMRKCV